MDNSELALVVELELELVHELLQLTALEACFSTFCQANGAGTQFCTCFTRGYDLGPPPDCECISLGSLGKLARLEFPGCLTLLAANRVCDERTVWLLRRSNAESSACASVG
jgi:hypothetical protein